MDLHEKTQEELTQSASQYMKKLKDIFPSLAWQVRGDQKHFIFFLAVAGKSIYPMKIEVAINIEKDNSVMAVVTHRAFSDVGNSQLFSTPNQQGVTLDEALAQLKHWFEQMAEVFAGVGK
jgi:hypothetical protein